MRLVIFLLLISTVSFANYVEIGVNPLEIYVKAVDVDTNTLVGSTTVMDWQETEDTMNLYNAGVFTAPQDDIYTIKYAVRFTGSLSSLHMRYVDGSFTEYMCFITSSTTHICSDRIKLDRGQTLHYRVLTGATTADDPTRNYITISNI
jgi:hypothetical protein